MRLLLLLSRIEENPARSSGRQADEEGLYNQEFPFAHASHASHAYSSPLYATTGDSQSGALRKVFTTRSRGHPLNYLSAHSL